MKSLLKAYQGVGKTTQAHFNKHTPFLLAGPKPPTWQTPGRLQYYRAENEVYLPGKSLYATIMHQSQIESSKPLCINTPHHRSHNIY